MTKGGAKRILATRGSAAPQNDVTRRDARIDMRGLGKHASAFEQQTQLPRCPSARALFFIDDNSVQQSLPANLFHKRMIEPTHRDAEMLPKHGSPRAKFLVDQDLQGRHRYRAAKGVSDFNPDQRERIRELLVERVPSIRAAVFTGLNHMHDILVR